MINSLVFQTYFNPDEHWQALEIAHHVSFGYGHLTWEWKKGIRTYLHPVLFAALYKVLAFFSLDTPWFMTRLHDYCSPYFLPSVISSCTKYLMSCLATMLQNWHMETILIPYTCELVLLALLERVFQHCFFWFKKVALAAAAVACAIHPTSAITWVYVALLDLYLTRDKLKFILLEVVPIGGLVLGLNSLLDRLMCGSWVLVPLNFLKFNFLSSGGDYYGTHALHWYITQGFTAMLFTFLPFSISGIIISKQWKLSGMVAWVLGIYSLIGHKEFRFALPVLPIALVFAGYTLAKMKESDPLKIKKKEIIGSSINCFSKVQMPVLFLIVTNLPMALYMSTVHQRETVDVMNYLSAEAVNNKVESILFLMPCHATPYYSTLHCNLPMRFLDYTPSEEKGILDESNHYLMDSVGLQWSMQKIGLQLATLYYLTHRKNY